MKELDELREWGQQHKGWHLFDYQIAALADAIEQAIAERYVELPTNFEGETIFVGHTVDTYTSRRKVKELRLNEYMHWEVLTDDGMVHTPQALTHPKPDTWEGIIRDAVAYTEPDWKIADCLVDELVERCKALAGEGDE